MTFLSVPETTPEIQAMYDGDIAAHGYVMNLDHAWAHQPQTHDGLFALLGSVADAGELSVRERGILVTACASTLGDSYCSLAWGEKLSRVAGAALAAAVLSGSDEGLTEAERAMARWARQVASDPNATTAADVESMRSAGLSDAKIFAITAFVALRLAFSTVNDALGAVPDEELRAATPSEVLEVVTWGRQPSQPKPSA